jgi:hypothetical protein
LRCVPRIRAGFRRACKRSWDLSRAQTRSFVSLPATWAWEHPTAQRARRRIGGGSPASAGDNIHAMHGRLKEVVRMNETAVPRRDGAQSRWRYLEGGGIHVQVVSLDDGDGHRCGCRGRQKELLGIGERRGTLEQQTQEYVNRRCHSDTVAISTEGVHANTETGLVQADLADDSCFRERHKPPSRVSNVPNDAGHRERRVVVPVLRKHGIGRLGAGQDGKDGTSRSSPRRPQGAVLRRTGESRSATWSAHRQHLNCEDNRENPISGEPGKEVVCREMPTSRRSSWSVRPRGTQSESSRQTLLGMIP